MIVLLYRNNGEQYEDYREWVYKVYNAKLTKTEIIKCDKNPNYLDGLYRAWFEKCILLELDITVNTHWIDVIMTDSKVKSKKLFKEFKRKNTFEHWLTTTYKCKELPFQSIDFL